MLDPDLKRFETHLNQTRAGLRLRLAFQEGRIACQQIERLRALNSPNCKAAIQSWQRAYIKASTRATEALDALWDDYQWPPDAARERSFVWCPTKNLRRP